MASKTEIANIAISHLSIGKEITDLETGTSNEAKACRRYYDIARKEVLEDLDWTFATKFATLGLIEEDPTDEWDYSYRYPSDCINLRRILSGQRDDTQESRVPFKILSDNSGKIIYTDQAEPDVEYTFNCTNTALFSSTFIMALSFKLASYIAPRLTAGDPFKMGNDMMAKYDIAIGKAKKRNMNEEVSDKPQKSKLVRARS